MPSQNKGLGKAVILSEHLHNPGYNTMALLEILRFPDPRLSRKAHPVEEVDDTLRKTAQDMSRTCMPRPVSGLPQPRSTSCSSLP